MIDFETQIINDLYNKIIAVFPNATVGTIVDPTKITFPYVNIIVSDSAPTYRFVNSSRVEKYRDITIEVEVYSNLVTGRKAQAKAIMGLVDSELLAMGATGTSLNPLELTNPVDNSTVFRYFARYRATVDENGTFYSRR